MATADWQVYVDGVEFYGYHGASEAEREVGHRFRARLEVDLRGIRDPQKDRLGDTVDYSKLADVVHRANLSQKFETVEALGWAIATMTLDEFPLVTGVTLTLEKALPPMPCVAEAAGITLRLERD